RRARIPAVRADGRTGPRRTDAGTEGGCPMNRMTLTASDRSRFEAALREALERIDRRLTRYVDTFPAPATEGLRYAAIPNEDWTAGFWTGKLWLAYETTGDRKYRLAAERQLPSYRKRVRERIAVD